MRRNSGREEFMGLIRKLTEREIRLVSYLANKANYELHPNWLEDVDVMPLADGGMGSIIFTTPDTQDERRAETLISDCEFKDIDNITVIASLYIDGNKKLYELDIWKTDFSPLIEIPHTFC